MSDSEREDRALDALFVSQLRRHDQVDIERLPKLTEADLKALEDLDPGFIDRLWTMKG